MGRKLNRRRKETVSPDSIAARKAGVVMTLTRRDALVRQLDTAIRMWFLEQDPISIHLLLMPAYYVLSDLGKKSGNGPDIHELVSKSNFSTVYDWLRHGSSDPEDFVDFPPRVNEFLLWGCTISFEKIFQGRSPYMMAFQAYFVLNLVPEKREFREGAFAFLPYQMTVEEALALSRTDFFVELAKHFGAEIRARSSHSETQ